MATRNGAVQRGAYLGGGYVLGGGEGTGYLWCGKVWGQSALMGYARLSPCFIVLPTR